MGDRSPGDPEVAAILRRLGLPEFEDKLREEQIDLFALTLMEVPHFQRLGMQFDKAVDLQKYVAANVPDGTARATTDRSVSDRAVSDTDSGGETQRMDGNLTTSTATRVGINIERTDLQTVSALTLSAEEDSTEDADSVRARDADFARSAELGMDTTWETTHTAIRDTTELLVISLQPDEVEISPYQQLVARGGKIIPELVATIVEQEYSVLQSIGECADLAHSANSTEVLANHEHQDAARRRDRLLVRGVAAVPACRLTLLPDEIYRTVLTFVFYPPGAIIPWDNATRYYTHTIGLRCYLCGKSVTEICLTHFCSLCDPTFHGLCPDYAQNYPKVVCDNRLACFLCLH